MKKNRIRLTESQLRNAISKRVRKALMESTSGMGIDADGNKTFDTPTLPLGYDDKWLEDEFMDNFYGNGLNYGDTTDRIEHMNGNVSSYERERQMDNDWRDKKFNDFQTVRYNNPYNQRNYNVDTFDDEDGYYEHPSISQWDAANRERGVVSPKKQDNGYNSSFDSPGRLMFNDEGEYMGLTESRLRKLIKENVKKVLNEMDFGSETANAPYDAWTQFLGGKQPLFEFEDGIVNVDYDENSGTLCSGHVTNIGFHKDGEVEVPVEDGNFQAALEEVYSQLSANHEEMY